MLCVVQTLVFDVGTNLRSKYQKLLVLLVLCLYSPLATSKRSPITTSHYYKSTCLLIFTLHLFKILIYLIKIPPRPTNKIKEQHLYNFPKMFRGVTSRVEGWRYQGGRAQRSSSSRVIALMLVMKIRIELLLA